MVYGADVPCRQKSGIWGFRSDRVENISGYDTKVSANPLTLPAAPPHSLLISFPFLSLSLPSPPSLPPPLPPFLSLSLPFLSLPSSPIPTFTKVFSASGLDIVTKTRVEHLPEAEKHKHKSVNPLQDFLGGGQDGIPALDHAASIGGQPPPAEVTDSAPRLSMEEYFHPPEDPKEYDGR